MHEQSEFVYTIYKGWTVWDFVAFRIFVGYPIFLGVPYVAPYCIGHTSTNSDAHIGVR